MDCFFCRGDVYPVRSPLDELGQPPDIWRAVCSTSGCVPQYDFIGTLKSAWQDLASRADLKSGLLESGQKGIPAVLSGYKDTVIIWRPQKDSSGHSR